MFEVYKDGRRVCAVSIEGGGYAAEIIKGMKAAGYELRWKGKKWKPAGQARNDKNEKE